MQDRLPLYPGRVQMIPVPGQANTYDMVRADQPSEPGTPLNKSTLLADETVKALGLNIEDDPTPNNALFQIITNLFQHASRHKQEGPDPLAALDIGAFPYIDARSSDYDMDAVLTSGFHFGVYRIGSQTLGTPADYDKTDRKFGLIFSFASSVNFGVQLAILAGAECPFYRLLSESSLYTWSPVYNGWRPPIVTEIPGATQINLRWTNASPTSAFPAQTINFGLDIFDMYIVVARQSTTQTMCVSVIQKVGGTSKLVNLSYSSGISVYTRTIGSLSDGSLKFYDARTNGATDNTALIPLYVYGIGEGK